MTLDFIQICYDESQKEKLYDFATPYFNTTLTDYFENKIIADLVPNLQAELISICSWRLAQKRGDCYRLPDKGLSKEKIIAADFDIAILTPRNPQHKPLLMAHEWHGLAWDNAFAELKKFLKTIGINVPEELTTAIYENHFIAKRSIYQAYIKTALIPCIDFIRDKEVFKQDAGYLTKKRDQKEVKAYQEKSGRKDWPIAPFILERLFSIFIEGKGYKVISL